MPDTRAGPRHRRSALLSRAQAVGIVAIGCRAPPAIRLQPEEPPARSRPRVDHRQTPANGEDARVRRCRVAHPLAGEQPVEESSTDREGNVKHGAVGCCRQVVRRRREEQHHGAHDRGLPATIARHAPGDTRVPANLSLEIPDVSKLGLHLDDEEGPSQRVKGEDVDPSPRRAIAESHLTGDQPAGSRQASPHVGAAPGVDGIPLVEPPDRERWASDEAQLDVQAPAERHQRRHGDPREPAPLEQRHGRLRHAGRGASGLLCRTGRAACGAEQSADLDKLGVGVGAPQGQHVRIERLAPSPRLTAALMGDPG